MRRSGPKPRCRKKKEEDIRMTSRDIPVKLDPIPVTIITLDPPSTEQGMYCILRGGRWGINCAFVPTDSEYGRDFEKVRQLIRRLQDLVDAVREEIRTGRAVLRFHGGYPPWRQADAIIDGETYILTRSRGLGGSGWRPWVFGGPVSFLPPDAHLSFIQVDVQHPAEPTSI